MANTEEEVMTIEKIDYSLTEAQTRAEIDTQIATAKAYPRDITKARSNAIATVIMDVETAKICGYSLPRGGKIISGPSVHLAKIIAQLWGNLRMEEKEVAREAKQVISQASVHDLESNIAYRVEIKRNIIDKNGRKYTEDMITVTGRAAASIALRNAILSVIPKSIVDSVYKASQGKIIGDVSDEAKLLLKRKQYLDALKDNYQVKEEDVVKALGLKSVNQIKAEQLIELVGMAQAIKDGASTVDDIFYPNKTNNDKVNDALKTGETKDPEAK